MWATLPWRERAFGSLTHSLARLFAHSVARSLACSLAHSLTRSLVRSLSRSLANSPAHSLAKMTEFSVVFDAYMADHRSQKIATQD